MISVVNKILLNAFISLLIMVCSSGFILYTFPLYDWTVLWTIEVLDLPFYVLLIGISLGIGMVSGLAQGLTDLQKIKQVEKTLEEVARDSGFEVDQDIPKSLEGIYSKIHALQHQLQEQTLISQKLVNERAEFENKYVQEIISQERNRLARELHDSVSQQLFAASMLMSAINENDTDFDDRKTKQLKMVEEMIHQSQLEMRALLLHLRPVALKGKSLQAGIKELLTELLEKVPLDIEWNVEDIQLSRGIEDHLFRILQESVSNTLRHAKASKLEVMLIQRDQFIIMRVTDNGVGFEIEESKTGSYGLQNMRERAAEIGGTLKIVSLPGKGTKLEVKVPIIETNFTDNE